MLILIGCEFSGALRDAFRALGHDAWSCDLRESETPGPHIRGDVLKALRSRAWGGAILHPPCTYLAGSGLHWNGRIPGRAEKTEEALQFVAACVEASDHIPSVALENPVGLISTEFRKPDQTIQPYQFGDDASKRTCLWIKGWPLLQPLPQAEWFPPRWVCCGLPLDVATVGRYGCAKCKGEGTPRPRWGNQTDSGQNRLPPSPEREKLRSVTYPGIARSMAHQWGGRVIRAGTTRTIP